MVMLSVSYAGKNVYSAGKTSGVLRGGASGAMCSPTVGGGLFYAFLCPLVTMLKHIYNKVVITDNVEKEFRKKS